MNAVSSGKLKYVMTSVTKTNTGLTAYLGFLNSLAGQHAEVTLQCFAYSIVRYSMKATLL